jgi:hypothetical protein
MSKLLSIKEAAEKMGVSPETLKSWCNHVDPLTGHHSPKIEHVRLGGRGRPNRRLGVAGQIKIFEHIADRFLDERTIRPSAEKPKPDLEPKPRPYRSRHF